MHIPISYHPFAWFCEENVTCPDLVSLCLCVMRSPRISHAHAHSATYTLMSRKELAVVKLVAVALEALGNNLLFFIF